MTLIFKPAELRKLNGCVLFFAGMVGLLFYGLGYGAQIHSVGEMFIVAIQAVSATISMFKGENSYSTLLTRAPWFAENMWMQVLYWLAVLSAMYFTAALILGTLGKRFLRFLRRCAIGWRKDITLFYPTNEKQIELAENICENHDVYPVFIGECEQGDLQERIENIGGVIWENDMIRENGKWLDRLGVGKDKKKAIKLFVAGENDLDTKKFLKKVIDGMENTRTSSANVTMMVLCEDEQEFVFLTEEKKDDYYLQADLCPYKTMAAKVLTKAISPWEYVTFNENGEAVNGFHAMILGFGQVGQSILCELLRNSQFVGKETKIQVVDKNYKEKAGAFLSIYKEMIADYDIEFVEMDVFSQEFFEYLEKESKTLNSISICMGESKRNQEAASQIRFFKNRICGQGGTNMAIATCTKKEIIFYDDKNATISIPNAENLWDGTMDDGAKGIHKIYMKNKAQAKFPNDIKKQEDYYKATWYKNSYSDRLSCDASAMFIPAMYRAAGIAADDPDPKRTMANKLKKNPVLLENLSKMEHQRWNAYSYTRGVTPMSLDECKVRVDKALAQIKGDMDKLKNTEMTLVEAKKLLGNIKDAAKYTRKQLEPGGFGGIHVCLSDWDVLEKSWIIYEPLASAIAEAEHAVALIKWKEQGEKGPKPEVEVLSDFRQLDRNNVINLMDERE